MTAEPADVDGPRGAAGAVRAAARRPARPRPDDHRDPAARGRRRHRAVRRRQAQRRPRARGPRLLRRRQPAAGAAAADGRARRPRRPAAASPPSSTSAAGPSPATCRRRSGSWPRPGTARGWSTCTPATRCWSAGTSPIRREHPLQGNGRLIDGIAAERALLTGIAGEADLWVDTSDLNVHQLRATLENAFAREGRTPPLTATVLSFGFKYGLPARRRPRRRRPLPAQPALDPGAAAAHRPGRRGARLRARPARRRASSSTATPTCCGCSSPATGARASGT